MATKPLSVVDAVPSAESPAVESSGLAIDELNLLRLTRASEKGRAARLELMLASAAIDNMFQKWISENKEAKELNDRIISLQKERKKAEDDYTSIIKKVSEDLKIDVSKYEYDDETGALTPLPEKPAQQK